MADNKIQRMTFYTADKTCADGFHTYYYWLLLIAWLWILLEDFIICCTGQRRRYENSLWTSASGECNDTWQQGHGCLGFEFSVVKVKKGI